MLAITIEMGLLSRSKKENLKLVFFKSTEDCITNVIETNPEKPCECGQSAANENPSRFKVVDCLHGKEQCEHKENCEQKQRQQCFRSRKDKLVVGTALECVGEGTVVGRVLVGEECGECHLNDHKQKRYGKQCHGRVVCQWLGTLLHQHLAPVVVHLHEQTTQNDTVRDGQPCKVHMNIEIGSKTSFQSLCGDHFSPLTKLSHPAQAVGAWQ